MLLDIENSFLYLFIPTKMFHFLLFKLKYVTMKISKNTLDVGLYCKCSCCVEFTKNVDRVSESIKQN